MNIPIITNIFRSRERARLRRMMRGFRLLKQSGQLAKISNIKEALTNTVIEQCQDRLSQHIFGAGTGMGEQVIRQYLLLRIGGTSLNKSILLYEGKANASSKLIHPMPREWQTKLEEHGIRVAKFRSSLLWKCYVLLLIAYGLTTFFKHIYTNFLAVIKLERVEPDSKHAYFLSISKGNLPNRNKAGKSYDILSWYYERMGSGSAINNLYHGVISVSDSTLIDGVGIKYRSSPIPPISDLSSLLFVIWGLKAIGLSFLDFLRGRWWHAFILHEATLAAMVRLQKPEKLAQDYLFNNSNWFYRPLWTYDAEKLGARILFYFYSTNVEQFRRSDGNKGVTYGWQAASWPHYLVWDNYQVSFLRNEVGSRAQVSVVGTIWFNSNDKELPPLPANTIAVFDVQPIRDSLFQALGADSEYYTPHTTNQFLIDIYEVLAESNFNLALKCKRNIGKLLHPKYEKLVGEMSSSLNLVLIEPEVSASHVIENCCAVISIPFTSTALLGKDQNKPSIYYDPNGFIQKNKTDAHGVELLSGKDELRQWLKTLTLSKHESAINIGFDVKHDI